MQRLSLAGLFCLGGALSALWLPQDRGDADRPAAAEAPTAPAPRLAADENPAASGPVETPPRAAAPPQRARPPAKPRPEADLSTRDLVLRDDDTPGAVETILDVLDRRVEVRAADQSLVDFLETLARKGEFNLQLAEHLLADPQSALRTQRVTVAEPEIRVETVLDRILEPIGLDWWIHEEALAIDLPEVILSHPEVRTYDVARLLRHGHTLERLQEVLQRAGLDPVPCSKGTVSPVCRITGGVAILSAHQPAQRIAAGLLAEFDRLVDDAEEHPVRERVTQLSPPPPNDVSVNLRFASQRTFRGSRLAEPRLRSTRRLWTVADEGEDDSPDPYQQILDALEERRPVDFAGVPWRTAVESLLKEADIPFHFDEGAIAALDQVRDSGDDGPAANRGQEPADLPQPSRLDRELRQTPVRMLRRQTRLEAILNTILDPRQLAWLLLHDRLVVTTAERAGQIFETKPYDVANLLDSGHDELELTAAIREVVLRDDGANLTGDSLVIRQTQQTHWRVAQVLAELDELAERAAQTEEAPRDHFTWKAYRVPDGASEALLKLLPQLVAPESWLKDRPANSDRVGGELRAVPGLLLVKQTLSRHRAIEQLLNQPAASTDPFGR